MRRCPSLLAMPSRKCFAAIVLLHAVGHGDTARPQAIARRPPVARTLVDTLFLGSDPMVVGLRDTRQTLDEQMTHVSGKDIDMVLSVAPQPVSFWLELGAYEGGSAILTARRAEQHLAGATAVVAVDTFLGDARTLWLRTPEERRELLRPDGTVSLYDTFRANVRAASLESAILPFPATSVVALRVVRELSQQGEVPAPQVIYLDSAHEEGEVLLELRLAWEAVAEGGIVFGDDWVLPGPGDSGGPTQRDVLRFAEARASELDDTLGERVKDLRTLGRVRPGLFVSYNSFQWFMRKLPGATPLSPLLDPATAPAGFDCWSSGYKEGDCCDSDKFGPDGNSDCWDLVFTFERCCPR